MSYALMPNSRPFYLIPSGWGLILYSNHFPRKRAEIEEARRVAEAHRRYDSHNIDENSFDQLKDTVDGCNRILKALEEHRDKWVELKFLCEFVGVQLNRFNSDSLGRPLILVPLSGPLFLRN